MLHDEQELELLRHFVETARRFPFTAEFVRRSKHLDAEGRYS